MPYTVSIVSAHPGGFKPRQYFLTLTWVDSTDPNAASVNVYRSTVSGGPYTLIQSGIGMGVQTFDDLTVLPGVTYYYVTTEVDSNSNESGFSAEQSGTPGPR